MKRIIFALLYSDGSYMLSRNFRLQRVGDIDWVLRNYEIRRVSLGIDELMVLDVSRGVRDRDGEERFRRDVSRLVEECFIPVTVGGHLRSIDHVARCFEVGADKVLMRTAFAHDPGFCEQVASRYGSQAVIAGIDVSGENPPSADVGPWTEPGALTSQLDLVVHAGAGEVLVQSVENDGTGKGLDLRLAEDLMQVEVPLIMMGGIGHAAHIVEGLRSDAVDAVATANLFNFVGESLVEARAAARTDGVILAEWRSDGVEGLRDAVLRDPRVASLSVGSDLRREA